MDVMNDEALNRWWRSLSPAARQQLMRDPYASIPAELAQQVVRCSLVLLRTYWPETYPPGPSFRLPDEIARWVRALSQTDHHNAKTGIHHTSTFKNKRRPDRVDSSDALEGFDSA